MPTITISEHFSSDPQTAFDTISDFPNAENYISGIKKVEILTQGPVAVGTRIRETRIMLGREATEEMEITKMDAPQLLVVEAFNHGTHYITTYTLTPQNDGTDVELEFRATPKTFMSKVLAALFSKMISSVADLMQKDLIEASKEAARRVESKSPQTS